MDIEKELKKRNLTQKELAELLCVTPSAVCAWISGKREVSTQVKMLLKLSTEKLRKIKV